MSRLNELFQELCSDGVEYKKLSDVSEMQRGKSATKKTLSAGEIPVISGGREPSFYCNTYNRVGETITVAGSGAGAGFVQYWNIPIFVSDAFSIKGSDGMLTKFLYYYLQNKQKEIYETQKGGGVPHVHISSIEGFKIPVPPLEVQQEIVCILDTFSELTAELTANLTAELTARKKQYEYYKNTLLNIENVEYKKLEDVATIKARIGWQGLTKSEYLDSGEYYLVTGVDFNNGLVDWDNCHYVEKTRYEQDQNIQIKNDDVLVTKDGTLGKVAYVKGLNKPATLNSGVFVVRSKTNTVLNRFLFHYLNSPLLMKFANSKLTGGTIKHLNQSVITQLPIPIPSIEEQTRIVSILDRFDALCNDLTQGIPAEINARQKQYEYYRDKLLTFNEKPHRN